MTTDHLPPTKRMRPGVKALIVHDGKILMIHEQVQRDGNPVEIIDFPGGGIEFGEGLQDALIREVKEEVGLDIAVGKVIGAWDFVLGEKDHEDPNKSGVHIICIGYACSVIGNPVIDVSNNPAQEDIYAAKWYSKTEILENHETMLGNSDMVAAVENIQI